MLNSERALAGLNMLGGGGGGGLPRDASSVLLQLLAAQPLGLQLQYAAALAAAQQHNSSLGCLMGLPLKATAAVSAPCTPYKTPAKQQQSTARSSPASQSSSRKRVQCRSEQKTRPTTTTTTTTTPSKRSRTQRKLMLEEDKDTLSPVSGMHIRAAADCPPPQLLQVEMDETARFVEISDETRAALDQIPNLIGDYVCALCSVKFADAFRLAQHRCARIVHEEYRCPECDKVFSCPANLASHRRWHKPRQPAAEQPLNLMMLGQGRVVSPLN